MTAKRTAEDEGEDPHALAERRKTARVRWAAGAAVALALLFAGAATVASARGDGEPGAPGVPSSPAADSADAGFARDMAVHHQQAVEMSFIVRDRTDDEDVRRLAYDIANTQANQRGMLLGWLDLWELPKVAPGDGRPMAWMGDGGGDGHAHGGHGPDGGDDGVLMPGMVRRSELERLGRLDGERAEVLFLQLMTDHHKGGVAMAEACVSRCSVPAERRLARGMVEGQQSELGLMRDMLAERGAKPRP